MDLIALVKHVSEWLSKKNACVIFQDTISRMWPIAHPKEAQERDAMIQEWAKSHGWEAKIKDNGVRVTFKKLSEPIPGQQSAPNTLATLPNSCDCSRMPKRTPAKPNLDANQTAVALLNNATGSKPANGEDLLVPRLAKQLREAKATINRKG